MGVSRYLREHKPGVQVIAAEPRYGELVYGLRNIDEGFIPELYDAVAAGLPVLRRAGGRHPPHPPAGGARGHLRRHLDRRDPARGARHRRQGGRGRAARRHRFIVSDGGWKYLSTGAYAGTLEEATAALEGQLWA